MFDADTLRVAGSGGCNRVSGRFEIDGDRLRFGPMALTRMACPAGMDLDRQLLDVLAQAERYRICGSFLEILDVSGNLLAQFASDGKGCDG